MVTNSIFVLVAMRLAAYAARDYFFDDLGSAKKAKIAKRAYTALELVYERLEATELEDTKWATKNVRAFLRGELKSTSPLYPLVKEGFMVGCIMAGAELSPDDTIELDKIKARALARVDLD